MIKIKIQKKMAAALVAIIDDKNQLLILNRPGWVKWAPHKWAFAGGTVEPNESPHSAAVREVKEETTLDVHDLKKIGIFSKNDLTVYYTRNYRGEVKIDFEHEDWRWVSPKEIEKFDLAPNVLNIYRWILKNG